MADHLSSPEEYRHALRLPILVQLGLTYRCNLACSHCYALYRRDRAEFSLTEINNLANELYEAGAAAVVYSHGENLIRSDFHEAAGIFRDLGFYQTLMLNGFYIRTRSDAQRLADSGVNRAMISVDSADPPVHDRVRGRRGAYQRAMGAIEHLLASDVDTVGFSCTIGSHNYDTIADIVDLALRTGVHAISFMQNRYNLRDIFDRSLWWRYEQVCRNIYELMLEHCGRLDIYTHDPFMLTLLDDRLAEEPERAAFIGANLCNVAKSMVSIDPVGNVTGCNFIPEVIGNVREEPFSSLWERLVRRYSHELEQPTGACSGCRLLPSCMGGCRAFHYIGNWDERCGETRFGELEPHGLSVATVEAVAPSRAPGAFLNRPRDSSRLAPRA